MSVKLREKELADGRISLYLDIYHEGKRRYDFLNIYLERKRSSAKTDKENLELAKRICTDTEHKLKVQQRGLPDAFNMDADIFEFIRQRPLKKQKRLKAVVQHMKDFSKADRIPFKLITKEWLLSFQAYLTKGEDRIENSVSLYMVLLNGILNEAMQEDVIPFNPWKKIPSHQKAKVRLTHIDPLEPSEIRQMIEHSEGINRQVKQCFLFSVFTGLRWGDASNLKKSTIRSMIINGKRRKFVVFTQRKTKTIKNLPLSSEAIQMLSERLLDEREEINGKRELDIKAEADAYFFPLFVLAEGDPANRRHGRMQYELQKWAAQAGIKKRVHFHLSRHTFATMGIEKIGDLHIVSNLLGHNRLATTQRYAHVLDRLKIESIDRISSFGILR